MMVDKKYLALKHDIDFLVSNHLMNQARQALDEINIVDIPQEMRSDFAKLARRANRPRLGVKILQQSVYGVGQPHESDILEYAASIRKLGLVNQCLVLLNRLTSKIPERHLYTAFCNVHLWNYKDAKEDFLQYLNDPTVGARQKILTKVNLVASCLFLDEIDEAEDYLHQALPICKDHFFHLYLNCLELQGQIHIKKQEYEKAIKTLDMATELGANEKGATNLFIEKWKIVSLCLAGKLDPLDERINNFKKDIREQGHWESLRDFDWHLAAISGDKSLLNQVYFGTPYPSFRKRMREKTLDYSFPSSYIWLNRISDKPVTQNVDLFDAENLGVAFGLGLHRLWLLLSSDFYRPWSIGRIFDSLFPEEVYDPFSSPKRIYALIKKLQDHIDERQLPFELKSTINGYRMRPLPGGVIYVGERMSFASQEEILHYLISDKMKLDQFSVEDLGQVVQFSKHKWYRLLKKLEEKGLITHEQKGKKSIYKLNKVS